MAFVSGRPAALLLPALAALLLTAGCSPKKYGAVQFHSEPEEAEVLNLRDDALLGLTPVVVVWESDNGGAPVRYRADEKGWLSGGNCVLLVEHPL